ncbi:MAG: hypothetical protein LQ348_001218 [Seirophora lacunosa]|nr:MAG: hypothetical protein LQ348_001218 [Seirophora lacunosa]
MTSGDIVQDSFLQSVLVASTQARLDCHDLIALAERSAITSSQSLSQDTKLHLSRQQRQLNSDLASLRDASRESILEVRMTKQSTSEARQEVDRLHLQLQNLYYEERHLRGEIYACESYEYAQSASERLLNVSNVSCSHQYQQLPLIPLEEFLQLQPEHKDISDEKSLMFARISHELAEREALEQQRQELLKTKQRLIMDNKKRKDDLASLDKDLETFIDVRPVHRVCDGANCLGCQTHPEAF